MNMAVELGGADGVGGKGYQNKTFRLYLWSFKNSQRLDCMSDIYFCLFCLLGRSVCVLEGGGAGGSQSLK